MVVARVVGVGEERTDVVAPAHITIAGSRPESSRAGRAPADGRRNRATPLSARLSVPQTPLSRSSAAPASSDSFSTSTTGAALSRQRAMSATASRLVSTIRPCAAAGGVAAKRAQQRAQALVLQLAGLRSGAVLQRLDPVEHEQQRGAASSPRRSPRPWRRRWSPRPWRRASSRPNRETRRPRSRAPSCPGCRTTSRALSRRRDNSRACMRFSHSLTSADLPAPPSATSERMLTSGSAQASSSRAIPRRARRGSHRGFPADR